MNGNSFSKSESKGPVESAGLIEMKAYRSQPYPCPRAAPSVRDRCKITGWRRREGLPQVEGSRLPTKNAGQRGQDHLVHSIRVIHLGFQSYSSLKHNQIEEHEFAAWIRGVHMDNDDT